MRKKKSPIGRKPSPPRTRVSVFSLKTGETQKYVESFTVYADPKEVANLIIVACHNAYGSKL